jgi:hypothetical protein
MKFKKRIAVLLAATMVLGSTVTVMADSVPGGGSATGAGTSEGHLEREIGNVVLPTSISANAFNYTIDPERLVNETNAALHTGATFAGTSKTDGVFFLVDTDKYDSKTNEYEVTNKSTFPIDVTVKIAAPAEAAATDIALVSENALTGAKAPGLYLGLKMGATPASAEAVPVAYGKPAESTVSVNAVTANFEASVSNNKYVYKEKATASGWLSTKFYVEGKTTNGANGAEGLQIADDTTAPTLTVTWSWKKYGGSDTVDANISKASGNYYISVDGTNGFASKPTITVDGAAYTSFTYSNGWVVIPTSVGTGKEVLLTVGSTVYKVTTN